MIKRVLKFVAIIFIFVIFPKNINAIGEECTAKLDYNRLLSNGTRYYSLTLNGKQAICIDPGKHAPKYDDYQYFPNQNNIDLSELQLKALYSYDSIVSIVGSEKIAQELLISAGHDKSTLDFAEVLKNNGYSVYDAGNISQQVYSAIMSSQSITLGDDAVIMWDGNNENQRLLVLKDGVCTVESTAACPGGAMNKSGSIGSCSVNKGGNTFSFSNTAGAGSQSNIHRRYGIEKQQVGSYCSLYCQEYGVATLPGATGEPFNLGSYIIWPTSNKNHDKIKFQEDYYPLKFQGRLECHLGVAPDEEMPGDRGQCKIDPIVDYTNSRATAMSLYNSTDYNSQTYEFVRKNYIGRTKNAGGACKSNYDTGGRSCRGESKCLTPAKNRLAKEQKELARLQTIANNVSPKQEKKCDNPYDPTDCHWENTAAYASALAAVGQQDIIVKEWQAHVNKILNSIENCTTYIESFENACDILHEMRICGKFTITANLYDFRSNASLWYQDKEYATGVVVKESSSKSVTKQSVAVEVPEGDDINDIQTIITYAPNLFKNDINSIKLREFEVTASETYTLNTGYSYIDKDTLDYKKSANGLKNYINISKYSSSIQSVIPTSYNNEIGKKYYLSLNNITFGSSLSNFGNGTNYVCTQKFSKDSADCICPINTDYPGKNLTGFIANNNETCADAQAKYCNISDEAPPDDFYCDKPYEYISIMPCVNAGGTVSECKSKYCSLNIECPNTYGVVDDSMNARLRACVQTKMEQGISKKQAIAICEPLVCPIGRKIIYRTIRLENPFPSMDSDSTVIQSGLKKGMFNNDIKGRYPGTNWNSETLVRKKIINNRGVSGTSIYQTKEPLYTFVLNNVTIKKIREYNDKQNEGYNDFNGRIELTSDKMTCYKNNSSACVSSFVHNSNLSGLVSGSCQNATNATSFYTCDD